LIIDARHFGLRVGLEDVSLLEQGLESEVWFGLSVKICVSSCELQMKLCGICGEAMITLYRHGDPGVLAWCRCFATTTERSR
jgi:hypothetical protein